MNSVKVRIPATVANMVCGFDILGMAVESPYDEIELRLTDHPGIVIKHTDHYNLPTEAEKNVAGVSLLALMEAYGKPVGFEMIITKNIKPGSGLGSSAASAAGAVVAANKLLGNLFSNNDLVGFAMNGEQLASGVKHADNITPCIFGSVTLVRSVSPLDIVPLSAPPMFVTIVHPQIEVKTSDARQILKKEIQLKDAIQQWGNIAGLVSGLLQKDYELIGRSLKDVLIEPVRSMLIPGFDEVKKRSIETGALGGGISGSGPSVFMLSKEADTANRVEKVMADVYRKIGIEFKTYVTAISKEGVKVIDQ